MKHNINLVNIKKRCNLFLCIFILGLGWSILPCTDLLISLNPEASSIFLGFILHVFSWFRWRVAFTLGTAYLAFWKKHAAAKILRQDIYHCFPRRGVGFVIGNIFLLLLFFIPYTNYVLCERPGPTSGTYYTRTEEICEQVKHLAEKQEPVKIFQTERSTGRYITTLMVVCRTGLLLQCTKVWTRLSDSALPAVVKRNFCKCILFNNIQGMIFCGAGVVIIYATYAYRLWDERIY